MADSGSLILLMRIFGAKVAIVYAKALIQAARDARAHGVGKCGLHFPTLVISCRNFKNDIAIIRE